MTTVDAFVDRVKASGVLRSALTEFPEAASPSQVQAAEKRLGTALPEQLRQLLLRWNGANLEVVRLLPCAALRSEPGGVVFANDPAGFRYLFGLSGEVVCVDSRTRSRKRVAVDISDFLTQYVFGHRAHEFGGEQWASELRGAGLAI